MYLAKTTEPSVYYNNENNVAKLVGFKWVGTAQIRIFFLLQVPVWH